MLLESLYQLCGGKAPTAKIKAFVSAMTADGTPDDGQLKLSLFPEEPLPPSLKYPALICVAKYMQQNKVEIGVDNRKALLSSMLISAAEKGDARTGTQIIRMMDGAKTEGMVALDL